MPSYSSRMDPLSANFPVGCVADKVHLSTALFTRGQSQATILGIPTDPFLGRYPTPLPALCGGICANSSITKNHLGSALCLSYQPLVFSFRTYTAHPYCGGGGVVAEWYTQSRNGRFLAYIPSLMEKFAQAGEGGRCTLTPLSLQLPSRKELQCTLQLSGQIHSPYFISTNICTLWWTPISMGNKPLTLSRQALGPIGPSVFKG